MKYYLINNTIKKGSEMPEKYKDTKLKYQNEVNSLSYDVLYKDWLSSLQPCEIDGKELANIKLWVNSWETNNPIDITDIVSAQVVCNADRCDGECIECTNMVLKVKFKQPTGKQVESDAMIKYILEIDALTTTEFCNKYNVPKPVFTGEVNSSVNEMLRIDAVKHRMFVQKAKEIFKNR